MPKDSKHTNNQPDRIKSKTLPTSGSNGLGPTAILCLITPRLVSGDDLLIIDCRRQSNQNRLNEHSAWNLKCYIMSANARCEQYRK
jgi:hypothetical protein